MIFTIEQIERFKQYARRCMVRVEEWKNNRDIQVGRIAEEIQGAFSEGYHTAMHEVSSTPWEYHLVLTSDSTKVEKCLSILNLFSDLGWESIMACDSYVLIRRRKAVAGIEAKSERD